MVRKTREEAQETRNQLLDAAEVVFYEKGFSSTTLMAVANQAGMTRGAIYWHFKNKSDLFEAMVERVKVPLESIFEELTADSETQPFQSLKEFSLQFLQKLAQDEHRARVFTIMMYRFEMTGQSELVEKKMLDSHARVDERLCRALKNAVRRGELPHNTDIQAVVIYIHAFIGGVMRNWLFNPASFNLGEMAELLVEMHFNAVLNAPPLR